MSTAFHVHVYWRSPEERAAALALREGFAERFPSARLGRVHEAPMAFHTQPMYQVHLDGVALGTLLPWLRHHRRGLSVLLHPLTGDVVAEHLDEAIWLGRPLPLDEARLRASASAVMVPSAEVEESRPRGRTVLRVDASARREGSVGRQLADELIAGLGAEEVLRRDLLDGLPLLDAELLAALGTAEAKRSAGQRELAATSEALIAELERADMVVLSVPIYNFHAPAAFKAWVDLVARARRTFRYSASGPVGLLADRPVYVVITSGGTRLGSAADFVSGWLRHVLGFIGLQDVRFIEADGMALDAEASVARARAQIAAQLDRSAA